MVEVYGHRFVTAISVRSWQRKRHDFGDHLNKICCI